MKIDSVNTTTALALFLIAFAIILIGALVVIPAGTLIQEAQAQQQTREARPQATENMPDGPSEISAADDPAEKGEGGGDDAAPDADDELDTVTVCIGVSPNQMTQEVMLGEAQFLEETIPESELSYGACEEG